MEPTQYAKHTKRVLSRVPRQGVPPKLFSEGGCFLGSARVVDLCCGMGGLSVAAREMGMTVVAGVDVNPSALRTFSRNFPQAEAIEGSVQFRSDGG